MKLSIASQLFYNSMITVKKDSTIKWYHKKIDPLVEFLEDKDVETVDLFDLENFRATLYRDSKAPGRSGKVTDYTVHGYVRAQRTFFHFLRKRKIIHDDPSEELQKPRLPKQPRKGITPESATKMINTSKANIRDYAMLLFFRDTACRAGGVYNLLTENLDLRNNRAVIREKGDKERTVFFTPVTTWALVMYAADRVNPKKDDHFFLNSHTHEALTYAGVYQIFRRLAKELNIKNKFSPHEWRHAAARSWIDAGMNLKTVSEILGHSTVKITGDIYGTLSNQELQIIYNRAMACIMQDISMDPYCNQNSSPIFDVSI